MTKCIVCGSEAVEPFLDLGRTALANKFLNEEELSKHESKYPLKVGFCCACGHVQLTEIVPPSAMFTDYLYLSSSSDTLKAHLYDLSDVVVDRYGLGVDDLEIDIGCNDGTLLNGFKRHRLKTLGVDPAENLAELTNGSGIERYVGFFNSQTAQHIVERWGRASVITATNTFPHIPDLHDFVEGIKTALAPGGVFVIEMHYLVDLLDQVAFDTIYHEHVSYWALRPMMILFERNGMQVVNAEHLALHHGQLRVFVKRIGEGKIQPGVARMLNGEAAKGIRKLETFQQFAIRTMQIKENLRCLLMGFLGDGKRIVGYGAPAKGNTLLGFLEIGPDKIEYIVDRNLLKQGRYTPGTHIPVVPVERLLEDQPDYALLLAWNFLDEILSQEAEYRRRGGKFILPVPEVQIV